MTTANHEVTDATVVDAPNSSYDLSSAITAENAGVLLNTKGTTATEAETPVQPTTEQLIAYMQHMRRVHNAKCRKKGFKGHIHQASGHKLQRKLERQGSVYGHVSLVSQMYNDIQARKYKDAQANAASVVEKFSSAQYHTTNTDNPIDFPKETNVAI